MKCVPPRPPDVCVSDLNSVGTIMIKREGRRHNRKQEVLLIDHIELEVVKV